MAFGLEFINKLRPCKWRYRPPLDDGKEHFGFIAQEVDELAPRAIYDFVGEDPGGILRLNMYEFVGPLVKAVQELSKRVEELEHASSNTEKRTD
jgi:hypothetical protein